jgi:hypothetical protein
LIPESYNSKYVNSWGVPSDRDLDYNEEGDFHVVKPPITTNLIYLEDPLLTGE